MPSPRLLPSLALTLAACGAEPATDAPVGADALLSAPPRAGWESDAPYPGFNLVAPLKSHRVHLVDMQGNSVHSWWTDSKPGETCYLTDRGTLLKAHRKIDHPIFGRTGGHGGWMQEIDWDGTVLWEFHWDTEDGLSHHDLELLPNGNILFVAWDRTTRDVALAAGRDPELLEGEEWWAGAIYEVRPTPPEGGEIVWSWHAMDHLVQDFDPDLPNYGDPAEHPHRIDINGDRNPEPPTPEEEAEEQALLVALGYAGDGAPPKPEVDGPPPGDDSPAPPKPEDEEEEEEEEDPAVAAHRARIKGADWMHTNAVAYNAELDQIAISLRTFDEIWIIDHGTTREEAAGPAGDLLYRWGNPFAYGLGEFDERDLMGQHNVQWIPEGYLGEGNLIVFDNGTKPREWSRIVEWSAPRTADGRYPREEGEPWGPEEPEWVYQAEDPESFRSPFISGVQRLANGNTLVCSGAPGRVFEVTPDKQVVWDWRSPFTAEEGEEGDELKRFPTAVFRVLRYAPDHPGVVALRDKGAPIPLDPGTGPPTNQYEPPPDEDEDEGE